MQAFLTFRALPIISFIYVVTIKIIAECVILKQCPKTVSSVRNDCQLLKNILRYSVKDLNTH